MSSLPKEKEKEKDCTNLQIHRHDSLTLTAATAFQQQEEEEGEYWVSVGGESLRDEQVRKLISHGLLAIGTFGLERVDEEVKEEDLLESMVERVNSDVTAGDVELFHEELQKAFGPRKNHPASSESLSLSLLHGNSSSAVNDLYPLQQFFLSKAAIPIINNNRHRHHKKHDTSAPRTSLRDLFSRNSYSNELEDEPSDSKDNEYNVNAVGAKKSGGMLSSFVKKVVKVKTQTSEVESRCKVEKVMQRLFHTKIFPDHDHAAPTHTDTAVVRLPRAQAKKKSRFTSCIIPPRLSSIDTAITNCDPEPVCSGGGLCSGHERWINTDPDYLVLEF